MRKITIFIILSLLLQNVQITISEFDENTEPPTYPLSIPVKQTKTPGPVFKFLSHNLLEGGGINKDWKDIFVRENPDIMFLTETGKWSPEDDSLTNGIAEINALFPDDEIPFQGAASDPDSVTDGQAVLSRYPIKSSEYIKYWDLGNGTTYKYNHALLHTVVDIYGMEVHIVLEHFSFGNQGYEARLKEYSIAINFLDSLGDVPIIFAGDFNSNSPEDDLSVGLNNDLGTYPVEMIVDVNNPHHSKLHNFTDVYRTLNPYLKGHNYIDDTFESRIDYVFVNQHLSEAIVNSTIALTDQEAEAQKDHIPFVGYFNMDWENVDLRPPIPPHYIETNVTSSSVSFSWPDNKEVDLAAYRIYRNDTLVADLNKNITKFTDDGLPDDTVYRYMLHAVDNSSNQSPVSIPIFIKTGFGMLYEPTITSLKVDNDIPGANHLTWEVDDGGSPIIEYRIYRSLDEKGTFVYQLTTQDKEYVDTRLRIGQEVFYKVRAINAIGKGKISMAASGVADPIPLTSTTDDGNAPILIFFPSIITLIWLKKYSRS